MPITTSKRGGSGKSKDKKINNSLASNTSSTLSTDSVEGASNLSSQDSSKVIFNFF